MTNGSLCTMIIACYREESLFRFLACCGVLACPRTERRRSLAYKPQMSSLEQK